MIKPWKILESRLTFQDPYLKVRTDRCQTEAGHIIDSYHVLEYESWLNAVVLTPQFDCVLIREYRHGNQSIQLGLPGGGIEEGESTLNAAQREVLEETGYQSDQWHSLGSIDVNPNKQTNKLYSYLALNARKLQEQTLDSSESIEIVLWPFMEVLRALRKQQEIVHALYIAPLWASVSYILEGQTVALEPLRQEICNELRL